MPNQHNFLARVSKRLAQLPTETHLRKALRVAATPQEQTCACCGELWERYYLRHQAIFDAPNKYPLEVLKLYDGDLNGGVYIDEPKPFRVKWRDVFRDAGFEFDSSGNLTRCPSCEANIKANGDWKHVAQSKTATDVEESFKNFGTGLSNAAVARAAALYVQGRTAEADSLIRPLLTPNSFGRFQEWVKTVPKQEGVSTSKILDNPRFASWVEKSFLPFVSQLRKGQVEGTEPTNLTMLQNPGDTSVVNADPDLEALRQQAQTIQQKVNELSAQAQQYVDALANKAGAPSGGGMMSLQQEATRLQTELENKLKALPQNFIRFADNVVMVKKQAARLNDASWKDMVEACKERGKGVMQRVVRILDRVSILFKKMTASIKLEEYGPGELGEKDISKISKKNKENADKISNYAQTAQDTQPLAQKYFTDAAEGKIQYPGFKGAQLEASPTDIQEPTAELDELQELIESLDDSEQDIQHLNDDIQNALNSMASESAVQQEYPMPEGVSEPEPLARAAARFKSIHKSLLPIRRGKRLIFSQEEYKDAGMKSPVVGKGQAEDQFHPDHVNEGNVGKVVLDGGSEDWQIKRLNDTEKAQFEAESGIRPNFIVVVKGIIEETADTIQEAESKLSQLKTEKE